MIEYRHNFPLDPREVVRVFDASGINRPTNDLPRITKMFNNANLVISAWDKGLLIGVCRALTDYSYCCYLSDLAIDIKYQRRSVGKTLISNVQEVLGEEVTLILLSAPEAMKYYPHIGLSQAENAFVIKRSR